MWYNQKKLNKRGECAMARYIPVYWYPDRMPIDISFAFEDEKPAAARLKQLIDTEL